jgi:acetylglutamate kinase
LKLLIKIGGTLLDHDVSRQALAGELAALARTHQLIAVHGGGMQLTRFLEERGVKSRFVNGLRVSDGAVIDAVSKVIAGSVNKQLVSALIHAGRNAVGLSGVDGCLTIASQLAPELGYVGKPVKTDNRLLEVLLGAGYTPVVACIAGDAQGNIYNVNADQMAASCASGWGADKLIFLTDVQGVKGPDGEVVPELTRKEITRLISLGVAHGGMHAKLDAAAAALDAGLGEVIIAAGHEVRVCSRLAAGEALGTRVRAEKLVAGRLQE